MTEDEAKAWAKDKANQKSVIQSVFDQQTPVQGFFAIFMAGIPGAGKTEFVKYFPEYTQSDFVVIEHDVLVTYIPEYDPEHYYEYRKAGSVLVTALFNECLKRGYSFIMDGTLAHDKALRNIQKSMFKGYGAVVIYVQQDINSAWQLTKERELLTKRAIGRDGFIKTARSITRRLRLIFETFHTNKMFALWIVKKNGEAGLENAKFMFFDYEISEDEKSHIEQALQEDYNIDELEK